MSPYYCDKCRTVFDSSMERVAHDCVTADPDMIMVSRELAVGWAETCYMDSDNGAGCDNCPHADECASLRSV